MLFPDYTETKMIYHIVSIVDLHKVLKEGIKYNDKKSYISKYYDFHDYIDKHKTDKIPSWVLRKNAIFGSLNFSKDHSFHSHTALLAVKINSERTWIANENLANHIYEPFILQDIKELQECRNYLERDGSDILTKYWETSISFKDNLIKRYDDQEGYDAELLILQDIKPKDIEILKIVSDHNFLSINEWKNHFCKNF